ncbi:MAG: hypothetical protein KBA17_02940 [Aliarcobacter sp.]|jgi:hypothetical protein|nr:hypothetical protein [Aliarcobacter sp.]MBP9615404.1 hypothetical protein [Aliarcobacter sp.]
MQVYLYAKSGHTIGLEATKRCAAIANALKEFDPILCTSDFRAGAFAKDLLGIRRYVNIDVIRNLHNIMEKRDILIYDTPEINDNMKKDMTDFCTLVYGIDDEIKGIIVDSSIYNKTDNTNLNKLDKTIFFGDDDYNNIFLEMAKESEKQEINMLMGHYFFLGNEKVFLDYFSNVIDEEEYVQTIKNSKYLLTASLQSALESLACGNFPVLFKRFDKNYDEELITNLNIPVIKGDNLKQLIENFSVIINNYPNINNFNIISFDTIVKNVKEKIDLYNKLMNNTQ